MKGIECVWLQKMGCFWAVAVLAAAAAIVLAAAAVLTGSKKERERSFVELE